MNVELVRPLKISVSDMKMCAELVSSGGAVTLESASRGLKNAETIGLIRFDKRIVAVGALKNPDVDYKNSVFEKSKTLAKPNGFKFEAGYFATDAKFQGRKLAKGILGTIIAEFKDAPMFATTGSEAMEHLLLSQGFTRSGFQYKSGLGNADLSLLLRIK
jgi:hypothetical protein